MKKYIITLIFLMSLILTSCSTLKLASPESFEQSYAYAKTTESVMLEAAHISYKNGLITKATESYIAVTIENTNETVKAARELSKTDLSSATSQLNGALQIIASLKDFMEKQGITN